MNKIFKLLLVSSWLMSSTFMYGGPGFSGGGTGVVGDPYKLATLADLNFLSANSYFWAANIYFEQTADIDASATSTLNSNGAGGYYGFSPIGNATTKFSGSYDGKGFKITNLYINRPATDYVGLFGYFDLYSKIRNLQLKDVSITGRMYTGALIGRARTVYAVENCSSSGVIVGTTNTGGLIGQCESPVSKSYSSCSVSGVSVVGGLIGYHSTYIASNCYSTGSVSRTSGTATSFGGLVGSIFEATIKYCYSIGAVNVTGGGFAGIKSSSLITSCYWDTQTSGQATSVGGGTGKTTAEMKTQSTFTAWDFATPIWKIDSNNNGYPYLALTPEIDVKQSATAIADGTGTYGFGNKDISTNTDVVFTIENTGAAVSTLGNFTITGTNANQFSIQGTAPTTVAAGASATFTVRFSPTSGGAKTATIAFDNQDANENPYSFDVTGTGTGPMQLVFTTTNASQTIELPLLGTVNCTVNWGDGSATENFSTAGLKPHTFATAGIYTVSISGNLTQFGRDMSNGSPQAWDGSVFLTSVLSFGELGLTSLSNAFCAAQTLTAVPATLPSTVTDLSGLFTAAAIFNQDISGWDVSKVTNMYCTFMMALSFNQDIAGWNVGNVTNMFGMFFYASAFNNDISGWDVSKVENMQFMFASASKFNQNIGGWTVANVTTMLGMFNNAAAFDQNIGGWNVSNVSNMIDMFNGATLSTANYDSLLIGWAAQAVTPGVSFHGGSSKYSCGTTAETARATLTGGTNMWTITDGGLAAVTVATNSNSSTLSLSGSSDVEVAAGVTLTLDGNTSINKLTLAPTAKVSLGSNTLSAPNGVILQSSVDGTATILGDNAVSNATVQQYVTAGRNWYISSPLSSAGYADLSRGVGVVEWNEATKNWDTKSSGTLTQGKGYIQVADAVQTGSTGTLSFGGTTNAGNIDVAVTRTESGNGPGFNLVGNPYPSYLNWSSFISEATNVNISRTYWYRTKNTIGGYTFVTYNGVGGTYVTSTGTANTAITGKIPPMQGFWIRVNSGTASTTARFTNAMREHRDGDQNIFKAPKVDERACLRLQLINGAKSDETMIYFDENAANQYDDYDSPKMMNNSDVDPDLYTKTGNEQLVINGLKSLTDNLELPLGFNLNAPANLKIKAGELTNFKTGTRIYLLDKAEKTQTELYPETEYTFSTKTVSTNNENRFSLLFRAPGISTDVDKAGEQAVNVFVDATNQLIVSAPLNSSYAVYNAVGQQIENGILNYKLQTINCKLNSGIYVVKVGNQTTRVIIK